MLPAYCSMSQSPLHLQITEKFQHILWSPKIDPRKKLLYTRGVPTLQQDFALYLFIGQFVWPLSRDLIVVIAYQAQRICSAWCFLTSSSFKWYIWRFAKSVFALRRGACFGKNIVIFSWGSLVLVSLKIIIKY